MDSKSCLAKLVSFDTQIHNNTLEAVTWVKDYLQTFGAEVEFLYNQEKNRASLMAVIGDKARGGTLFSGHLDTVPADETFYKGTPFTLREEQDKLYGRGACDMKGPIAGFLAAVPKLIRQGKAAGLVLTHDEEGGFKAVEQLTTEAAGLKFLQGWKNCIVMEPTELKAVTAHKGTRLLEVRHSGLSGHSSRPSLCIDALDAAVQSYQHLFSGFRRLSEEYGANNAFLEPYSTVTCGIFKAGEAINTVSDKAFYTVLSRENPDNDFNRFFAEVFNNFENKSQPKLEQKLYAYAFKSSCDKDFLDKLNAGQAGQAVNFGTEAGFFEKAGIPTVVFGPGSITKAHTKDEYILTSELLLWEEMVAKI